MRRERVLAVAVLVLGIVPLGCGTKAPEVSKKPREASCTASLHAIVNAIRMYRDDWGAYPHAIARDPAAGDLASKEDEGGIVSLYMSGYLDDSQGLVCPEDKGRDPSKPTYTSYNAWDNPDNDPADVDQLYNWYGYADSQHGKGLETMREGQATYAPGGTALRDVHNRALWIPGPNGTAGTWTGAFPGLANKNAPDWTVVTHCPHHRAVYSPEQYPDLVAFLGGNVQLKRIADFDWVGQGE